MPHLCVTVLHTEDSACLKCGQQVTWLVFVPPSLKPNKEQETKMSQHLFVFVFPYISMTWQHHSDISVLHHKILASHTMPHCRSVSIRNSLFCTAMSHPAGKVWFSSHPVTRNCALGPGAAQFWMLGDVNARCKLCHEISAMAKYLLTVMISAPDYDRQRGCGYFSLAAAAAGWLKTAAKLA